MTAHMSANRARPDPQSPFGFMQAGLIGAMLAGLTRFAIAATKNLALFLATVLRPLAARVRKAPWSSAAIGVVALGYGWATMNALLWQTAPAPTFHHHSQTVQSANQAGAIGALAAIPARPPVRPAMLEITPVSAGSSAVDQLLANARIVGNRDTFVVQTLLARLGYFTGSIDGLYGPITARAIRAFETAAGADVHGKLTPQLIGLLDETVTSGQAGGTGFFVPGPQTRTVSVATAPQIPAELISIARSVETRTVIPVRITPAAIPIEVAQIEPAQMPDPVAQARDEAELVRLIQRGLASLGYKIGAIDGIAGETTRREIRRFETFQSLQPTGAISPDLVDLLRNANAAI